MKRKCFKCEEEILDAYFMLAIDRPYYNLFFHLGCYREIENMALFLEENKEKLYNYNVKEEKNERKSKRRRRNLSNLR